MQKAEYIQNINLINISNSQVKKVYNMPWLAMMSFTTITTQKTFLLFYRDDLHIFMHIIRHFLNGSNFPFFIKYITNKQLYSIEIVSLITEI